jgi:hypothetical protein
MSDDFVNQLTLNCLISKNQLQKLNKKIKDNTETKKKNDREIYGHRIQKLFNDLLVNESPEDLLREVNMSFEYFIDKAIYYLKAKDNNELFEKERTEPDIIIHDDIDFEKEEQDIARGDYVENNNEDDEDDNEDDEHIELITTPYIKQTNKLKLNPVGVDDIQILPLDWFQHVRQNYKKNTIIPITKDEKI